MEARYQTNKREQQGHNKKDNTSQRAAKRETQITYSFTYRDILQKYCNISNGIMKFCLSAMEGIMLL